MMCHDICTPVSAFLKIGHGKPYAFLFESVEGGAFRARYSIITLAPDLVWRCRGDRAEIADGADAIAAERFVPQPGGALDSLRDLIADEYPHLLYDDADIWGYCDGPEPKVVIPVTRQVASRQRTVLRPAGVLVVRGRAGHARLSHRSRIAPGELPGPAYPITLVAKQREMSAWAAGERFHNREEP